MVDERSVRVRWLLFEDATDLLARAWAVSNGRGERHSVIAGIGLDLKQG